MLLALVVSSLDLQSKVRALRLLDRTHKANVLRSWPHGVIADVRFRLLILKDHCIGYTA